MKKALITGIAGFAGSHLAEFLLEKNFKVYGLVHPKHSIENVSHLKNKLSLYPVDILNKNAVEKKIKEVNTDYIFHLAAFSSPAQSFESPEQTLKNNIFGELYLLEALSQLKSDARILVIGSADEYGEVNENQLPLKETSQLSPISPYAVSKVVQDLLGYVYHLHNRLNIVRVRPFNHIGPRQSPNFVVSAFAAQIASLEKAGGGTMKVGDLDSWRDFTDVRDIVRAYYLALLKGEVGDVYNIGSGKLQKIGDILKTLLSLAKVKINIKKTQNLIRKTDIKKILPDISKFKKQTGWSAQIPLEKTLFDTIEYERTKLEKSKL